MQIGKKKALNLCCLLSNCYFVPCGGWTGVWARNVWCLGCEQSRVHGMWSFTQLAFTYFNSMVFAQTWGWGVVMCHAMKQATHPTDRHCQLVQLSALGS